MTHQQALAVQASTVAVVAWAVQAGASIRVGAASPVGVPLRLAAPVDLAAFVGVVVVAMRSPEVLADRVAAGFA